jgi:hypothetical protein
MLIDTEKIDGFIKDLYDQYQREEEQAILQRSMEKAVVALCGKEACTRIKQSLGLRLHMEDNLVRMTTGKKRT